MDRRLNQKTKQYASAARRHAAAYPLLALKLCMLVLILYGTSACDLTNGSDNATTTDTAATDNTTADNATADNETSENATSEDRADALLDVNPNSTTFGMSVHPGDFIGQVSAWYFGHST